MIDAIDFEAAAIQVKEDRVALFRRECMLASVAVDNAAAAWLAHLWGADVSTQSIKRRAQIWETFGVHDIAPDITLALYGAALDAATDADGVADWKQATDWLQRARDEGWSSTQLRNAAGIARGQRVSDVTFRGHDVEVTKWDVPTGAFSAVGLPLSGEMPKRASVTVREILSKKES